MLNSEAFISEIVAQGTGEAASNEFVEVTISKTADLNDYTLSFYESSTGLLEPGYSAGPGASPGSSFFPGLGEFTLADIANQTGTVSAPKGSLGSGIGGLSLQIQEHPTDPNYWVIIIPFSGAAGDTNSSSVGTIALTNTVTGESEAYNISGGSTAPLLDGAAAGTTQVATTGSDSQIDAYGNITSGAITQGDSVLCFEQDVQISVPGGTCHAGRLSAGDKVICCSGDVRSIIWVGKTRFSKSDIAQNPKLRPIRIVAGALGNGCPSHDLLVSRQHRILIRSKIAERMFGQAEVLVAAIKLTELPGVYVDESSDEVTYVHLLLDSHEVLIANGTPAESLFTGPEACKVVGSKVWSKLKVFYPSISVADLGAAPARFIPRKKDQKRLVVRHRKNNKPIVQWRALADASRLR